MSKIQLIKVTLLIVILAEEIKRVRDEECLYNLMVQEDEYSGYVCRRLKLKELLQQINKIENVQGIKIDSN